MRFNDPWNSLFLGEVLSFENLVFSVFQFIQGLVETPKFKKTVDQHLEEILYYTMEYMQITENQVNIFYKCYV